MKKLFLLLILLGQSAMAADWSTTEFQYQLGNLETPSFLGGGNAATHVFTLQHASGWKYGDNFFFVDFYDSGVPGFNDRAVYSEVYSNFSLNKIRGKQNWKGPIGDLGAIMGLNWSTEAKDIKYLPGMRIAWNIPKFAFANLDLMALIDSSRGVANGGAPSEDLNYLFDFNWGLPFSIGTADFTFEGHVEFSGNGENELGNKVHWHILGQPQIRYDLGKNFGREKMVYIGAEVQFWINKLGDAATDEFAPQALLVWKL